MICVSGILSCFANVHPEKSDSDAAAHWAFQPLSVKSPPAVDTGGWALDPLDLFIYQSLQENELEPSTEATRLEWLRRVTWDLTGLPPAPEAITTFLQDQSPDAYDRMVDALLRSPRYGERWAQHWLDVVRYADTHGFEVNTERPNAWPYRDYVIHAFNKDLPYNQFVREQLVGDQLDADAATGFLITASVLLPGQIGQDEPSKRLARQDALDEIVGNIGQTFLGLTIGCARCHDHMFDPITQKDYFAMQAFVAGVEYEEREGWTPETLPMREERDVWMARREEVDRNLSHWVAQVGFHQAQKVGLGRTSQADLNVETFEPMEARYVRFTIHDANRHPSLGLIEPCIDEFEIHAADESLGNVALKSHGTRVIASGSRESDVHKLERVHDGVYGNGSSWMSDANGQGMLLFELPEPTRIQEVRWSRDRTRGFSDRLATAYTLEAGPSLDAMVRLVTVLPWQEVASGSDGASVPDSACLPVNQNLKVEAEESRSESRSESRPQSSLTDPDVSSASLADSQVHEWLDMRLRSDQKIQELSLGRRMFAGNFRDPDVIHRLHRGNPELPRELVEPAVPEILGSVQLPATSSEEERRRALAGWLVDGSNPLTARVMVNRIWQGHFGRGLVETPNDFGLAGSRPSHPELLEWLADEFIRSGWSLKALHRRLVLSATYRQSSRIRAEAHEVDADVRWLWRYPTRRMEAEALRDGILAVSGQLVSEMGGRGFDLFDLRGGLSGFKPVEEFEGEGLKRMIYAHKIRREPEAVFGAFDCPDGGQSAARRAESITAIQSLNLFNSPFTFQSARTLASSIVGETGEADLSQQVQQAVFRVLGREPEPDEQAWMEPFVEEHGLTLLCRVLLNSNEFVFIP